MEDSKMKKHVTAVAAIQIGFSTLWLILAVVIYFAVSFARSQVEGDAVAEKVLTLVAIILPVFIGVIALIGLIGGIGLLSYKQWGRIMTIIVSALGCFNIPIGTLIGVYSIWVLMQDETVKLFQTQ
jgi:ABC-type molybdate transport system permease subunit